MRLCFIICTFLICYAGLGLDFINQITGTITGSIINIAQTKNVIDTITGENRQQNNYRTNRPYYNNYDDDENDEYIYIEQTKRKNNTQSRGMTRNHRRLKQQKKIKIIFNKFRLIEDEALTLPFPTEVPYSRLTP